MDTKRAKIAAGAAREDKEELPYERFLRFGPEALTEAELLAIIIRTGTKGKSALEAAKDVLKLARYPKKGLLGLQNLTVEELKGISGIGEVKAVKLKCITELSKRMSRAKVSAGENFTTAKHVADYFMEQMLHEKKLSEGTVNMSLISPREIFLAALEYKAVNILLVHNHPSGDPTPSRADKLLTCNVREMGERIGILLLDHVVIGDNCHVSFKENGWFMDPSA